MDAILTYMKANWLSLVLLAGLVVALLFVYRYKDKFAKNEFE